MNYFNSQPHEEADTKVVEALQTMIQFQLTASRRGWPFAATVWAATFVFQLTASRRGWQRKKFICSEKVVFQLTASRRGWPRYIESCSGYFYFNSQPHEEADKKSNAYLDDFKKFQLTASRRGWPRYIESCSGYFYFNSQPHEEADIDFFQMCCIINISTHSLTKRLTGIMARNGGKKKNFNSQPHEEADVLVPGDQLRESFISTHSLTKRLTKQQAQAEQEKVFQLTASRRGWLPYPYLTAFVPAFQLTASRRGWRGIPMNSWRLYPYFNSQPHEEADDSGTSGINLSDISTHSLTKRLTYKRQPALPRPALFQLTASRRGWLYIQQKRQQRLLFQLTASRRGWQEPNTSREVNEYFNSQPHEEADDSGWIYPDIWTHFNSQPHEEADEILLMNRSAKRLFQLTASRRGWLLTVVKQFVQWTFQLTASRRGWHPPNYEGLTGGEISTHSLTKRLTRTEQS